MSSCHNADLPLITGLIDTELSEPYSIFTYRYFINNWRTLCWLVRSRHVIFCRVQVHFENFKADESTKLDQLSCVSPLPGARWG